MRNRTGIGDRVFYGIDVLFLITVIAATLYPFVYVLSCSLSDPAILGRGEIWLFPKGLNINAYKLVLKDPSIWRSYYNTLWYVVIGTLINIGLTTLTAYPLSRNNFGARRKIMLLITFTMFFSGGMVPSYLLVKNLHMMNTRWAIVVPVAISTWNLIIMRTFFENIPESLHEAATIDGCSEAGILFRIYLMLSAPVMAVMILFYAVGHWNSFFTAMLYLNNEDKYPLQMLLRKILIQYDQNEMMNKVVKDRDIIGQTIRYATIMVSTLPILVVYPFLQKYFVKGVMIGAIKG